MEATSDDKCVVCAEDSHRAVCELCMAVFYCGDACEAADFMSHRASCKFREKALQLQSTCVACNAEIDGDDVAAEFDEDDEFIDEVSHAEICTVCLGAKYCSIECEDVDADEHKLLCKDYAELPLRPTLDHRLHLFFPEDEDKARFVWISGEKSIREVVDPELGNTESAYGGEFFSHVSEGFVKVKKQPDDYRVEVTHTRDYSVRPDLNPNRSLDMPIFARALRSMKGNLLLSANVCVGGLQERGDVLPSDLAKLLAYFKHAETVHEESHKSESLSPQSAVPY